MASVSVSHMIIFIASMMVAASVAGVFTNSVQRMSDAVSDISGHTSQDIRTDVDIISDSGSDAIYNSDGNENITLHLKNTGSEFLSAEDTVVDVLVDGAYESDVEVTLLDGADSWAPGEVVQLEIAATLGSGDHRVKVIVNSDEEVFEFRT